MTNTNMHSVQEFDFEMLENYLLEIRCKPFAGRFNKAWEVFGCFLAYRHGFDSTSLLEDIYNPDRFNSVGFVFRGFEELKNVSDKDLSILVGSPKIGIQSDLEVFRQMYVDSNV